MRGQLGRPKAPAGPRARTMRQGRWRNGSKYPRLGISATSPGRLLACPTPRGGRGLRLRGGRGPRATRFQDAAPRRRGGRRGQRERQGPGSGSRGEGNSGLGRTAPDQARDARGPAAAPPERSQPRGPAAKALARAAAYAAAGLPATAAARREVASAARMLLLACFQKIGQSSDCPSLVSNLPAAKHAVSRLIDP